MGVEGRWFVFLRGSRQNWHFAYEQQPARDWRPTVPVVPCDDAAVARGAQAIAGVVAQMGCTCQWDEDGNPPENCDCAARMHDERLALAEAVLKAAAGQETT